MDDRRFDRFTRVIATSNSRRGVIRSLGAILASLAAGTAMRSVSAQESECPEGCPEGKVCRNGGCRNACQADADCAARGDDACVGASCDDGICREFIVSCEQGFVCCKNGECCPQSCVTDIDCYVNDPCREGTCAEGKCSFTRRDPCIVCAVDDDCAESSPGSVCCGGSCLRPCPEGTTLTKGCECLVVAAGGADANGITVSDTAAGADNSRGNNGSAGSGTLTGDGAVTIDAPPEVTTVEPATITTGEPLTPAP